MKNIEIKRWTTEHKREAQELKNRKRERERDCETEKQVAKENVKEPKKLGQKNREM